jgi:hypothetical protein
MMEAVAWLLGIALFLLAVKGAVQHAKRVAEECGRYSNRVYRDYDDWSGQ